MNKPFLCLLCIISLTLQVTTSGSWILKEMSNINYYPRKDFEFIEIHAKDFIIDPIKYGKFGWSASLYNVKVMDIVNKGSIFPGEKHIDAYSVSWKFEEAFYIQIDFEYVYNFGILPMSGKGTTYLHCSNATYTMNIGDQEIIPTIECKNWLYKDLKIVSGTTLGKMLVHIQEAFNQDAQIQTMLVSTFKKVMTNYYTYDYKEKDGTIVIDYLNSKFKVEFQWVKAKTNIKDSTLEFEYLMVLTPSSSMPRLPTKEITAPKDVPEEYSRMYFISRQLILDVANLALPKVVNRPIYNNMIPKESYWELELWNLQKVLPDLLMVYPLKQEEDFHLVLNYIPDESHLKLEALRKYSDEPFYRLSGLMFNVDFIKEGADLTLLMKTKVSLYVDLVPAVTEDSSTNMVTVKFTALSGDVTAEVIEDDKKGGFVFRRGLDEFIDGGLNDYLCRQLGHKAFGDGLQFQDFAHRGQPIYSVPTDDGVYVYLQ